MLGNKFDLGADKQEYHSRQLASREAARLELADLRRRRALGLAPKSTGAQHGAAAREAEEEAVRGDEERALTLLRAMEAAGGNAQNGGWPVEYNTVLY